MKALPHLLDLPLHNLKEHTIKTHRSLLIVLLAFSPALLCFFPAQTQEGAITPLYPSQTTPSLSAQYQCAQVHLTVTETYMLFPEAGGVFLVKFMLDHYSNCICKFMIISHSCCQINSDSYLQGLFLLSMIRHQSVNPIHEKAIK